MNSLDIQLYLMIDISKSTKCLLSRIMWLHVTFSKMRNLENICSLFVRNDQNGAIRESMLRFLHDTPISPASLLVLVFVKSIEFFHCRSSMAELNMNLLWALVSQLHLAHVLACVGDEDGGATRNIISPLFLFWGYNYVHLSREKPFVMCIGYSDSSILFMIYHPHRQQPPTPPTYHLKPYIIKLKISFVLWPFVAGRMYRCQSSHCKQFSVIEYGRSRHPRSPGVS